MLTNKTAKIDYIYDNINNINIEDRLTILKIIYDSKFKNKIHEKGDGCQIKLNLLPADIINKIYKTILEKITAGSIELAEIL